MAWDEAAKKLAIKTIGTVESNLKYDSIYYADAITIGIMQWYAGRAAHILTQLKDDPLYANVAEKLRNDVEQQPWETTWSWWSNRYLTQTEGNSLKPLLVSDKGVQVQNAQTLKDLEDYAKVAKQGLLDPNVSTNAFIFWCVMYHQSPREAKKILNNAGDNPSLDRLYTMALNNTIFRQYRSRYTKARDIILSGDSSGIPDFGVEQSPDDDGGDEPVTGTQQATGNVKFAQVVGDAIHVHTSSGVVVCQPTGGNYYLASVSAPGVNGAGPEVAPPTPPASTEVPPTADVAAKRAAVVNWMVSRKGKFDYSQGQGRLNPDVSGVGDCSSTVRRAYLDVMGIEIGFSTVDQETRKKPGKEIWRSPVAHAVVPDSVLELGDLIYVRNTWGDWRVRHVEMYIGNRRTIGHGGGRGPKEAPLSYWERNKAQLIVKRFIF